MNVKTIAVLAQVLTCADAKILLESTGHKPLEEVENGKGTGRVRHEVLSNGIRLFFEDGTVDCRFGQDYFTPYQGG